MRKTTLILAALAFALFTAAPAQASLILALDFGANSSPNSASWDVVVIDDVGSGVLSSGGNWTSTVADGSGIAGVITFSGVIGSFSVNITTGISKPLIGPRRLDLISVDVSGILGGGTLSITLIDTDYLAPLYPGPYTVRTAIGGTTGGTVFSQTGVSATNSESSFSGPFNVNTFGPVAFSSDSYELIGMTPGSAFSILTLIQITHTASGQITSFDQLVTVPEPASALLLALGFAGVVACRRRRSA